MNFRFIYRFHLEKESHVIWTWVENDKGICIRVTTLELVQQDAMATAYAVLEAVVISIGISACSPPTNLFSSLILTVQHRIGLTDEAIKLLNSVWDEKQNPYLYFISKMPWQLFLKILFHLQILIVLVVFDNTSIQ